MYRSEKLLPYFLFFPGIALILFFTIVPVTYGFYLSLHSGGKFVGLQNYFVLIFADSRFRVNAMNTLLYLSVVILTIPPSYLIAHFLWRQFRGSNFILRAILFAPFSMASIATATMFRLMVNPLFGLIPNLLEMFNITLNFYQDASLAMLLAVIHSVWRSIPFMTMYLLVGLEQIPRDVIDASRLDGASGLKFIRYITLPLTLPFLMLSVLMIFVWTINDFEAIYGLFRGGPGYGTEVLAIRLSKETFMYANFGLGAAIGFMIAAMSIAAMLFWIKIQRRTE